MNNVDWLGLALDLEQQAKCVESQTAERAMNAAAHGLRLMGAEAEQQAPSTAAQEDAVACIQAIKDWDTNGFVKRGALLMLPQEIRARMQAILDAALAHKGAQEGEKA